MMDNTRWACQNIFKSGEQGRKETFTRKMAQLINAQQAAKQISAKNDDLQAETCYNEHDRSLFLSNLDERR